ncbi:hypothetical protein COV15_03275 [Candidatus Woesearchaeota archaeon CG10_big_fil_rev_8_21_14_0_10_34_12]|nr:MAG: hypothetical protein COV15_03275 [Candidatus Woesearchaeota archaeon CG10_big_fil_rev_8_21_14_0_10_34_12]
MKKTCRALEELARLEQRLELKKGKFVGLIHTPTIKSLSEEEKKEFFDYMKRKGRIGKFLSVSAVISLILAVIFRKELTGNIISENAYHTDLVSIIFLGIFIALAIINISLKSREKKINRKLREHMRLAESIIG